MRLNDLKEEYAKDSYIDRVQLESAAANIPLLHAKWLRYRADARTMVTKADMKVKRLSRDRFMYYTGRHDEEVSDLVLEKASDLKLILAGDEDLLTEEARLEHAKATLSFIEDALRGISNMGFTIKHIIELRKLESGVV